VRVILVTSIAIAPLGALAQSSGPTEELTVNIAERALAPGTTREAAEAWLRYWKVDFRAVSAARFSEIYRKSPLPAGAATVLSGSSPLVALNAAAWRCIEVTIYLGADNRVLMTVAEPVAVAS
jgi:hypothetical protein